MLWQPKEFNIAGHTDIHFLLPVVTPGMDVSDSVVPAEENRIIRPGRIAEHRTGTI